MVILLIGLGYGVSLVGGFFGAAFFLRRWQSLNRFLRRIGGFALFIIIEFVLRQITFPLLALIPPDSNPAYGAILFLFGFQALIGFGIVYFFLGLSVASIVPAPLTPPKGSPIRFILVLILAGLAVSTFFGTKAIALRFAAESFHSTFMCSLISNEGDKKSCLISVGGGYEGCEYYPLEIEVYSCLVAQAGKLNSIEACERVRTSPSHYTACIRQFAGTPEHEAVCRQTSTEALTDTFLAGSRCLTPSTVNETFGSGSDAAPAWFKVITTGSGMVAQDCAGNDQRICVDRELAWLASIGADPNARDVSGRNALMVAAGTKLIFYGNVGTYIDALLAFGVDPRAEDPEGNRALDYLIADAPLSVLPQIRFLAAQDESYIPKRATLEKVVASCRIQDNDDGGNICGDNWLFEEKIQLMLERRWLVRKVPSGVELAP